MSFTVNFCRRNSARFFQIKPSAILHQKCFISDKTNSIKVTLDKIVDEYDHMNNVLAEVKEECRKWKKARYEAVLEKESFQVQLYNAQSKLAERETQVEQLIAEKEAKDSQIASQLDEIQTLCECIDYTENELKQEKELCEVLMEENVQLKTEVDKLAQLREANMTLQKKLAGKYVENSPVKQVLPVEEKEIKTEPISTWETPQHEASWMLKFAASGVVTGILLFYVVFVAKYLDFQAERQSTPKDLQTKKIKSVHTCSCSK